MLLPTSKDIKRFLSYVEETETCHLWTGPVSSSKKSKAGNFYYKHPETGKNKYTSAHKFSWLIHIGEEIPKGRYVRKSCGNSLCVNPEHLYLSHKCSDRVSKEITYPPPHEFSESDLERFASFVNFSKGKGGCDLWIGALDGGGYGRFYKGGKLHPSHKIAWMIAYGEIETEHVTDSAGREQPLTILRHKCDIRNCVNPEHLILGTQQDNVNDMIERNRQSWDLDYCPQGHKYIKENTYYHQGKRGCRECRKLYHLSLRTHCKYGHEFTPDNTAYGPSGKRRVCLTCKKLRE